jgi:hypothetical protein
MQRFTNLFMFRLSFQKIIKKIMKNEERIKKQHMMNLSIQKNTLNVLQKVTKKFFVETFENEFYNNLNFMNMKYQYNAFNDQFINNSRQKSHDTS